MGEGTYIAWADDTWNPWRGCQKLSPGCAHCYAETLVNGRMAGDFTKRTIHVDRTFNAPLRWNKRPWACDGCGQVTDDTLDQCGNCNCTHFHRRRVFSLSPGDWLDPEVPIEWFARMLDVIRRCPNLDFLLLTKRPQHWFDRTGSACDLKNGVPMAPHETYEWIQGWRLRGKPPANVWIGASVEDQNRADERIPELIKIPAKVRFLSVEPLLEEIDLRLQGCHIPPGVGQPIKLVIVGGESVKNARPCNVEWIRSVRDQCRTAGVACFVKQAGSAAYDGLWTLRGQSEPTEPRFLKLTHLKGGDPAEWPEDLRVREFPSP